MMSLEAIHRLNEQIATDAADREAVPYVPFDTEEVDFWPPIPFPNLGSLVPDGWERTETEWFVDKTGHGHEWEPALTVEQFKGEVRAYLTEKPGHGLAIVEEGDFQVYVAAFRQIN